MNSCCENMPFLVLWRTVTLQNDTQTAYTSYEFLWPKMLLRVTPKTKDSWESLRRPYSNSLVVSIP